MYNSADKSSQFLGRPRILLCRLRLSSVILQTWFQTYTPTSRILMMFHEDNIHAIVHEESVT